MEDVKQGCPLPLKLLTLVVNEIIRSTMGATNIFNRESVHIKLSIVLVHTATKENTLQCFLDEMGIVLPR